MIRWRPAEQQWYRFSAIALLLTAVIFSAVFIAYHVNWIRQRHEVVANSHYAYAVNFNAPFAERELIAPPGLLWLFGETGFYEVALQFPDHDGTGQRTDVAGAWNFDAPLLASEQAEVQGARRLFPEATKVAGHVLPAPFGHTAGRTQIDFPLPWMRWLRQLSTPPPSP